MFTTIESHSPLRTREEGVAEIGQAMGRFSMIVDILGDLGKAKIPFPGDADIRHGCERALTAMLVALARIEPVLHGKPVKTEETVLKLLHGWEAASLIDSDQLQRMLQFVERILGTSSENH